MGANTSKEATQQTEYEQRFQAIVQQKISEIKDIIDKKRSCSELDPMTVNVYQAVRKQLSSYKGVKIKLRRREMGGYEVKFEE